MPQLFEEEEYETSEVEMGTFSIFSCGWKRMSSMEGTLVKLVKFQSWWAKALPFYGKARESFSGILWGCID